MPAKLLSGSFGVFYNVYLLVSVVGNMSVSYVPGSSFFLPGSTLYASFSIMQRLMWPDPAVATAFSI